LHSLAEYAYLVYYCTGLYRYILASGASLKSIERKFSELLYNNVYDSEALLVYSDWLQEQGDVRGEIISIEVELKSSQNSKSRQLEKHLKKLYKKSKKAYYNFPISLSRRLEFSGKYGFLTEIKILSPQGYADLKTIIESFPLNFFGTLQSHRLGLTKIPEWIGELTELREINLSDNLLTELPQGFWQLSQLENLDLVGNHFKTLPKSIRHLQQMKLLFLSRNQLKVLPSSLVYLTQLEGLYLWNNELEKLPEWIEQLERLSYLLISKNNISDIPDNIRQLDRLTIDI